MKKHFKKIGLLSIAFSMVFVACKKDDTTAPVISLLGANPFSLEMLAAFVDPGATASDDEDGDISSRIVLNTAELNNKLPGNYNVHYEVSDDAGNFADAHRVVNVFATANALAKNYSVIDTCGTGSSAQIFTYTQSATANASNTRITFNKFGDYSGNTTIYADVAANGTLTIPSQTATNIGSLSEDHTFQGTGMVTQNGIYIEYTDTNLDQGSSVASCRAYFTRQ